MQLMQGDCLELMRNIPDGSVDMVLCDLPYGTTQLVWDKPIPLDKLWEQYRRVCKENSAIVLFSSQPFTTDLINSNRKMFKYDIVWCKTQKSGFYNAKKAPLRAHEIICVFYGKQPTYNPQKHQILTKGIGRTRRNSDWKCKSGRVAGGFVGTVSEEAARKYEYVDKGERYPTDVIEFSNWNGALFGKTEKAVKHPTAKPIPLLEYLIKTYTNEGDIVIDNCMGSGSTGVACVNTGRNFIGIELDEHYFDIARQRIEQAREQLNLCD